MNIQLHFADPGGRVVSDVGLGPLHCWIVGSIPAEGVDVHHLCSVGSCPGDGLIPHSEER